jgi:hypothetical protein
MYECGKGNGSWDEGQRGVEVLFCEGVLIGTEVGLDRDCLFNPSWKTAGSLYFSQWLFLQG